MAAPSAFVVDAVRGVAHERIGGGVGLSFDLVRIGDGGAAMRTVVGESPAVLESGEVEGGWNGPLAAWEVSMRGSLRAVVGCEA